MYVIGALLWVAILELGGVIVVAGLLLIGVWLVLFIGWWMNVGAKRVRLPVARVVSQGDRRCAR